MGNYDPIAYTYEADVHCEGCTRERFGGTEGVDSEGNEVGAISPWDEWYDPTRNDPQVLMCGTCGEVIEEYEP